MLIKNYNIMKKIILTLGITLSVLSCSDRAEIGNSESMVSKNDNSSFTEKRNPNTGVMASFDFVLGRKSKNCGGFGVCGLAAFGIEIIELPPRPETKRGNIVENMDGGIEGEYILDEPMTLEDSNFYIDEDIIGTDEKGNQYVLKKGEYKLDAALGGKYGGYTIEVEKL